MKKVIKFSTPTCSPCKTYSPIFKQASTRFSDVNFEEVDCTVEPDRAKELGIRMVPTTIFYKDDVEISRVNGVMELDKIIQTVLDM
jgi:thioredoxin-like negative regulator of GroEL